MDTINIMSRHVGSTCSSDGRAREQRMRILIPVRGFEPHQVNNFRHDDDFVAQLVDAPLL